MVELTDSLYDKFFGLKASILFIAGLAGDDPGFVHGFPS